LIARSAIHLERCWLALALWGTRGSSNAAIRVEPEMGKEGTVRTPRLPLAWAALVFVLMVPMPAVAFELSGGVSLGGFQTGVVPRFAISPHGGVLWRMKSDFLVAAHNHCGILPPIRNDGVGVYNSISVDIGYTLEKANLSAGPSLSIYSIPACSPYARRTLCGRVAGMAPGAHAKADVYFAGSLGVSVSANVDWIGGESLVLPGGVAVMVVAGPVLRWRAK
jgi:hypothetical protein